MIIKMAKVLMSITALVVLQACGSNSPSTSQASGESFAGETMRLIVPYSPGGSYDLIARTLAPLVEDRTGARVTVENITGAGGLVAMNTVANAEPDGLTVALFSAPGVVAPVLAEAEGVNFDLRDFPVVAQVGRFQRLLSASTKSEFETIDDVLDGEGFSYGTTGPGGPDHIDAVVLFEVLDIDGEIISGFEGASESELAITTGEVDGGSAQLEARIPAVEAGDHAPLLIVGDERSEEFPEVPHLMELEMDAEASEIAAAHAALQPLGRMLFTTPGVPDDRLSDLRTAFEEAVTSDAFQTEMKKGGQGSVVHVPGEEAEQSLHAALDAPEAYVAVMKQAMGQ